MYYFCGILYNIKQNYVNDREQTTEYPQGFIGVCAGGVHSIYHAGRRSLRTIVL